MRQQLKIQAGSIAPPMSIEEVKAMLDTTEKGGARNSIKNCLTVFQHDPLLSGAIAYNLLTDRTDSGFQNQITRLQFADLAVNLIEKATGKSVAPAENTFQDTSAPAVLKAVAAGVTAGKSEDRFAPNDKITRQEICVMLNRVIEYVDQSRGSQTLTNASTQMDPKFTDSANIDSWAVNSVALLTNNGLMSGKDGGRVAPKDKTKVEEAAILILALYNKF